LDPERSSQTRLELIPMLFQLALSLHQLKQPPFRPSGLPSN
jgi:hypothetical protein